MTHCGFSFLIEAKIGARLQASVPMMSSKRKSSSRTDLHKR